jgi:hypothetical protein
MNCRIHGTPGNKFRSWSRRRPQSPKATRRVSTRNLRGGCATHYPDIVRGPIGRDFQPKPLSGITRRQNVMPEGAGFCQDVTDQRFCRLSASVETASGKDRGSRRSARSVARTNGLDAGPAWCMLSTRPEGRHDCVVVSLLQAAMVADTLGQGRIGPAAGHPFAQLLWAWSGAVATRGVDQAGDHADGSGVMTFGGRARLRPECSGRSGTVERADVAVA